MIYLIIFLSFFQIGLLGFGGPFALLSFLEHAIVTGHNWLAPEEFNDLMVLSQSIPGSIGQHAALLSGFTATGGPDSFWTGVGGGTIATLGLALPAFLWTFLIEKYGRRYRKSGIVESVITLLRPLTPGLIAAALLLLCNEANFGIPSVNPWQFGISLFLFISMLAGTMLYRFNTLFMLFLCGMAGYILL